MFPNSFQKLQRTTLRSQKSKNKHASKMIKQLIHSAKIEKEIMLKVGLRTIDSHEVEEVDALLDSGVTGLFIDHGLVAPKGNNYTKTGTPY